MFHSHCIQFFIVRLNLCIFCMTHCSYKASTLRVRLGRLALQHLHEVLTATEAGRDSDINNSMENIMPRVKLIDASLKVLIWSVHHAPLLIFSQAFADSYSCPQLSSSAQVTYTHERCSNNIGLVLALHVTVWYCLSLPICWDQCVCMQHVSEFFVTSANAALSKSDEPEKVQ